MSDRICEEPQEKKARIEYETAELYKLVPLEEVLHRARIQISRRPERPNQFRMRDSEADKNANEVVKEVYKMLRKLINKTGMYNLLMYRRTWIEEAVELADRRLAPLPDVQESGQGTSEAAAEEDEDVELEGLTDAEQNVILVERLKKLTEENKRMKEQKRLDDVRLKTEKQRLENEAVSLEIRAFDLEKGRAKLTRAWADYAQEMNRAPTQRRRDRATRARTTTDRASSNRATRARREASDQATSTQAASNRGPLSREDFISRHFVISGDRAIRTRPFF